MSGMNTACDEKVKESDKQLQALSKRRRKGEERDRGRQSYEPLVYLPPNDSHCAIFTKGKDYH